MADFAKVLAAVDEVRGSNSFETYAAMAATISERVVETDTVASALKTFIAQRKTFEGTETASELLEELTRATFGMDHPPSTWLRTPTAMGGALTRLSPALRSVGFDIERIRGGGSRRWKLKVDTYAAPEADKDEESGQLRPDRLEGQTSVTSVTASQEGSDQGLRGDTLGDTIDTSDFKVSQENSPLTRDDDTCDAMTPSNPSDLIEPPSAFVATTDLIGKRRTEALSEEGVGDESGEEAKAVTQTSPRPLTPNEKSYDEMTAAELYELAMKETSQARIPLPDFPNTGPQAHASPIIAAWLKALDDQLAPKYPGDTGGGSLFGRESEFRSALGIPADAPLPEVLEPSCTPGYCSYPRQAPIEKEGG